MLIEKILKYPKVIIVTCLLITVVLGFFIKDLDIDNSTRLFFPQKDASYQTLLDAEDTYGSMSVLGVSISSSRGSILTPENIDVIRRVTDRVLDMADVEDIDSLTHIDFVTDVDGAICATQLIPEEYTGSEEDIAQLKWRLNEWDDMYDRVILNDDMNATQMQIHFTQASDEDLARLGIADSVRKDRAINEVKRILEEETRGHHLEYRVYGDDVITQNSRSFMMSDLVILIPVVILVVLMSLFFSFKTLDGTLIPLITVVMSAAQTCGLMALLGFKFTIVSSIIPVALIAVGSAYGIHVLNHYYVAMKELGKEYSRESYKKAIYDGVNQVKVAVFLSGLTTVVGFISLVTSPLVPLFSFSIFTAVGVAISLVLALTFVPALLVIKSRRGIEREAKRKERVEEGMRKQFKTMGNGGTSTVYKIYRFFCGTTPRIIVFMLTIIVMSLVGMNVLSVETAFTGYFPKTAQLNRDIDYVDDEFAGSYTLNLLVRGKEKGDICNVEILKAVDDMEQYLLRENPEIGKIVSFNTMLKRINAVWHAPVIDDGSSDTAAETVEEDGASGDWSGEDWSDWGSDWGAEASDVAASGAAEASGSYTAEGFDDLDWDAWGAESESSTEDAAASVEWVDPNIKYQEMLSGTMTVQQMLDVLHTAYIRAGGADASMTDIEAEVERLFNYNGFAFYEVPYDPVKYPVATREELRGVVENYLTLLSGSLDQFLNDEMNPSEMKIQIQLRSHSSAITEKINASAREFADEFFPEGYELIPTGTAEMERKMTELILSSQITSLAISIGSVFVIIALSFQSVLAGIIGAIPLVLTILLNYMVMGFAGIKLDLITSIIASVAVGVGIDYTIHILTTYKEERALTDDLAEVTRETFRKSGTAVITNAIAVGLGFLVLCLSKFTVLKYIGLLVGIVMFSSATLALTIVPGILNILKPRFMVPKSERTGKKKAKGESGK